MPSSWDSLEDEAKKEADEGRLLAELAEEFDSDPDTTLTRAEDLGYDIDDLPL